MDHSEKWAYLYIAYIRQWNVRIQITNLAWGLAIPITFGPFTDSFSLSEPLYSLKHELSPPSMTLLECVYSRPLDIEERSHHRDMS